MARNLSNAAASLLPYSTIEAAASGNVDAINAVLKHYERYIAALATRTLYDENGVPHLCLDEEKVCRMRTKLITKILDFGNVKKCAVGKHPKSEKHGNTAQFSEVERSGTQENCGGIGSGCRLRLRPLPVLHRRQSQRVARIDPNAVVVDKNIAENDRFDLFSRQLVRRNLIDLLFLERGEKALHPCVVEAMSDAAEALYHAAARQLCAKSCAGVLTPAI